MSKEEESKRIIRVAYLDSSKINYKELDEYKKAHPDCEIRACYIDIYKSEAKKSTAEEARMNLLESEIHEALRGFRIEELSDPFLLKAVLKHQKNEPR